MPKSGLLLAHTHGSFKSVYVFVLSAMYAIAMHQIIGLPNLVKRKKVPHHPERKNQGNFMLLGLKTITRGGNNTHLENH